MGSRPGAPVLSGGPACYGWGRGTVETLRRLTWQARAKLVRLSRRSYRRMREVVPLLRLLEAYATGHYRDVPRATVWAVAFAVTYFLVPVDAIPDVVAALGFADDAAVVAYVIKSIRDDLDRFEEWERRRS